MSAFSPSSALLRSKLVTAPVRDPDLFSRLLNGTAETKGAAPAIAKPPMLPGMGQCGAKRRQAQSYDRSRKWGRRRQMGGAGKLPNDIRSFFTEGERSVLTVIATFVKRYGECALSVARLAKEAGVCVRTVQYTLALARGGKAGRSRRDEPPSRPVLIHVEYRRERGRAFNDTNIITIVSREWLLWLHYRPSERPDTGCKEVQPNSIPTFQPLSYSENVRRNGPAGSQQWALEKESAAPGQAGTG